MNCPERPKSEMRPIGPNALEETTFDQPRFRGETKTFLLLQGHPSPFWRELGDALAASGHEVLKVHTHLGDSIFWGFRDAVPYRGRFAKWPNWLKNFCLLHNVTDILYYADQQPYHVAAREIAKPLGIRCWAVEFGLLRPDWLTVERDGMGPLSHFPKDRATIASLAIGQEEPDMKARYLHGFPKEASQEVTYTVLAVFDRLLYPFYRSDLQRWPAIEYLSWLAVFARARRERKHADRVQSALRAKATDFNLVAMQLRGDYQVRSASPYDGLTDFVEEVLSSFARNAPPDRRLVFKVHPLETGLPRWHRKIPAIAKKYGVEDRVDVIRGGNLEFLIRASKGVVLVNSTVGVHALAAGTPVCATGTAGFDLPDLTHQAGLDTFWTTPDPVDVEFFSEYRRALLSTQVKGSFYNPDGRKEAIGKICRMLTSCHPHRNACPQNHGSIDPPVD